MLATHTLTPLSTSTMFEVRILASTTCFEMWILIPVKIYFVTLHRRRFLRHMSCPLTPLAMSWHQSGTSLVCIHSILRCSHPFALVRGIPTVLDSVALCHPARLAAIRRLPIIRSYWHDIEYLAKTPPTVNLDCLHSQGQRPRSSSHSSYKLAAVVIMFSAKRLGKVCFLSSRCRIGIVR